MTSRRRLALVSPALVAALFVGSAAFAQANPAPKNPTIDEAANAAGQAARTAADFADQMADAALPGMSTDPDAPKDPMTRARDGVVLLERAGKTLGVGTVLDGDGRILTALSSIGHGNAVDARFADGSVTRLKVGHTDRAWDLALLVPKTSRWKKGLRASRVDATAAGSDLRSFRTVGKQALAPSRVIVKGLRTLLGGDSELLPDAVELGSRFKEADVGSPIVDGKGNVVAMIARACAPSANAAADEAACDRLPYGVPVSALKAFLRTVPKDAVAPAPWLGIQGVADDVGPVRGVRVLSVHPQSTAAAAGLVGGNDKSRADVVVAVNGSPVTTTEALGNAINERAVGDSVQLLLYGSGKFRQVSLTLKPAPEAKPAKKRAR